MGQLISPNFNSILDLPSGRIALTLPGPKSLQINCCRRPNRNLIARGGKVARESAKICLGPAESRRISLNEMCDTHELNCEQTVFSHIHIPRADQSSKMFFQSFIST
jgi:hypothetical protein